MFIEKNDFRIEISISIGKVSAIISITLTPIEKIFWVYAQFVWEFLVKFFGELLR